MKKTLRYLRAYRRKLHRAIRQRKEASRKWDKTGNPKYAKKAHKDVRRIKYLRYLRDKMLRRKKRVEKSHRLGIDVAFGGPSPQAMLDAGKTFIGRYLSHTPSKNLTLHEAITYSRAGIDLIVVWEDGGEGARGGYLRGRSDATTALAQARVLGIPHDRPIFFAVDFDAAGPEVESYFRGVSSVLGKSGSGIYAGIDAVGYILDREIVGSAWQTYAWSNHRWDPRARLRQVLISLTGAPLILDGDQVDYDKSVATDFGQWKSTLI